MKKKVIKVFVILILFFCGTYCFYSSNIKNASLNLSELAIHNIEALAQYEGINYACINNGDIDCYGRKVKFKIENLSFGY
ncbi:MAG: NVEALA domain-containing protein [Phocaeicola sp.]|nr:NVEALA domain-containing protein [Phocaeicola sp.]